jgi:hypothetical protein
MESEVSAPSSGRQDLEHTRIRAFVLWRVPWLFIIAGAIWPATQGFLWTLALAWIGGGCLANALRCGRVHCSVMGPGFLTLALVSAGKALGWWAPSWNLIWAAAIAFVIVGYLPEFLGKKYFGKQPAC